MAISRMQQPRQMYGLGSFVKKAVKGVTGAVKSFAKSDLGKAAGLAALTFGIPGTQFGGLFGKAGGLGGLKTGLGQFIGGLSGGKFNPFGAIAGDSMTSPFLYKAGKFLGSPMGITAGITAASALAAAGLDPENPNEMPRNTEALKSYLRQGYLTLNPQAQPNEVEEFVEANTVEYRANGGRIGFADGMPEQKFLSFEEAKAMNPGMFSAEVETDVVRPNTELLNYIKRIRDAVKKGIIPMDFAMDLVKQKTMEQGVDLQDLRDDIMETQRIEQAYGGRPEYAFGGRISLRYGGDTMGGINDKSISSPGPDRFKVSEQQELNHQEAVREAQAFNRNNTSPTSTPPTPKTNIFDKIKNNPIYQTVSPFVNPFSIGMSQIPVKAQQAIGIGSLLNKLGNVIFSPAGAAEFDMEAFQKAGADKGFFGGMNDELEAMQEYYDAAKSLTTPGAKFAGANNPQAVRDFITKQSEIPFGGGSYNIDMSLVPKTFLETQQDFTTQKAPISFFNLGGRAGYAFGDVVDQASGIMGLPQRINQAGVKELDLRDSGGFIPPVGVKEKADDIPAMLSNNEFVFTADAVKGMGDGDVNKGAQRMYDMMKKLENGGRV
jgi:hypothetical protein